MDQASGATAVIIAVEQIGSTPALASPSDHRVLRDTLRIAAEAVRVPFGRLRPAERPDGLVLVVDGSVSRAKLASSLVAQWDLALSNTDARVRCRVAMDYGLVTAEGDDWSGSAVATAEWLVDAPQLHDVLAASRRARLVLITSDAFYRSVVKPGPRGLDPSTFADITPAAEHIRSGSAWIHAVGYPWPRGLPSSTGQPHTAPDVPDRPARRAAVEQSGGFSFSGDVVVHGDMVNGSKIVRFGGDVPRYVGDAG